jgi:hypothetical protein
MKWPSKELNKKELVDLDEERKAAMVNNDGIIMFNKDVS